MNADCRRVVLVSNVQDRFCRTILFPRDPEASMTTKGINWHQTAGTMFAEPLAFMLTLPTSVAGNVGWISAGANNASTVFVGFGPDTSIPIRGVASATDGWPMAAGQMIPFLTGEGTNVGSALYAISNTAGQDFYIIGYAPNQEAS
jgi:hypothetical protein